MSSRKTLISYAERHFGVKSDQPFKKYPDYAALRHPGSEHWFALFMKVPSSRLNIEGDGEIDIVDIKCRPEDVGSLRKKKGFLPAYHMNKEHWITVLLDGSVESELIHLLMEQSFNLTK